VGSSTPTRKTPRSTSRGAAGSSSSRGGTSGRGSGGSSAAPTKKQPAATKKQAAATTKRPATRKPAAKKPAAKGASGGRGGGGDTPRGGIRGHLAAQRADVTGIALIVTGVVAGLGTYADAAGPIGAFLEAVALGLLGLSGVVVPVALAWFGILVVLGRPAPELGRIVVGSALLLVGIQGALHLLGGQPEPADGMRALWRAGGLVGWAIAAPLTMALSVWGATAVLVGVLVLGALIVTRTPFSAVVDAIRSSVGRDVAADPDDDADHDDGHRDTEVARGSSRRRSRGSADAADRADAGADPDDDVPADDVPTTRIRATLATQGAEQPPLHEALRSDDEAGLEAGRVPDPPVQRAQVPGDPKKRKAAKVSPVRSWEDYELPSLDLLAAGKAVGKESARTIEAQTAALQETFHQFGIDATVARWSRGPTVTRFEIELGPGVQVKKVANMGDDIAYALAAPDVRIVAPIPGKSAIGVEVPNRQRDLITLGDILRSPDAARDPHPMTVALGVDIAGQPALVNLTTMPHLLVSGATGSGKSVTLNGMIHSIIMRARPDQVRMILVDPKRVELNAYEGAPHLLSPVVTDPRRAADAVQWCVKEMEQRYELLAQLGFRNIDGYNEAVDNDEVAPRPGPLGEDGLPTEIVAEKLPYILLVIDELADLMLVAPRDVEDAICRIAQMARAVGIHMIIATQRPSVDVITGLIKANIPSRLALAVASQTDSRTIIDMNGAEKLVGKGDMLFLPASQGKPSRLQGCWVTEREITTAVAFCKAQREPQFEEVVKEGVAAEQADATRSGDDDSDEALLRRAAEQVVVSGLGSTSMLQRKLRIGFARAGRLMDELEELGVVGPNEGSKARDVLWSPEELDDARARGVL
jgi:S-DNA-T family DNA segregation ATPase FtsK/SpoIIIE